MKTWNVSDSSFNYLADDGTYMFCMICDDINADDMHFPVVIEPELPPYMKEELEAIYRQDIEGWTF